MMQTAPLSFHSSLREMIFHSSPISKLVLILLLFFSVLAWAIIIDKFNAFRKLEKEDQQFLELFRSRFSSLDHVYRQSQNFNYSTMSQLFRSGYRQILAEKERKKRTLRPDEQEHAESVHPSDGERERIALALEKASRNEINNLERFLTFLATAGSVSPFIGLFGTVWGIMNSFRGLGIHGSASIGVVAPGIAEALIATAAGLAAAIPAVIAYNHFLRHLTIVSEAMSDFSREFVSLLYP